MQVWEEGDDTPSHGRDILKFRVSKWSFFYSPFSIFKISPCENLGKNRAKFGQNSGIIRANIIQIYQALRKDSGNYISEEDWHISIFPRGEAPRKNRKIASPPKMCNFHYPFEIKAWYICFISLLYKFNT